MATAAFLGLTSLFGLIYLAYGVRTADVVTIAISTLIRLFTDEGVESAGASVTG